jgi:hypothetical protein
VGATLTIIIVSPYAIRILALDELNLFAVSLEHYPNPILILP